MEAMLSPWVPYTSLSNPLHNETVPVNTSEVPVSKLEVANGLAIGWLHADNVTATDLNFFWNPCLAAMKKRYETEDLNSFDLIILSIGIWDSVKHLPSVGITCGVENAEDMRPLFVRLSNDKRVIIRLTPLPSLPGIHKFNETRFRQITDIIKETIPNDRIIDHALLMEPRTQGKARIIGNQKFHFGGAARLAIVETTALFLENIVKKCRSGYKAENFSCPKINL